MFTQRLAFPDGNILQFLGTLAAALHPQEGNSSNIKQGIEGRRRERREGGREKQGSEREDEGAILSHTDWLFLIPGAS